MLASRFICSCMIFMSAATAPISAAVGRLAGSDVHHYRMIETIEYRSADGGSKYRSQSSTLITVDRPLRLDLGDGAAYEEKQYLNGGTRIACETEEIGYEYGPYLIGLGEDQTQSSNSTGSGLALRSTDAVVADSISGDLEAQLKHFTLLPLGRNLPDRVAFKSSIKERKPGAFSKLLNTDSTTKGPDGEVGQSDFYIVQSRMDDSGASSVPLYPLDQQSGAPMFARMATDHVYIQSSGLLNQVSSAYVIKEDASGGKGTLYIEYLLYRTDDGQKAAKPYSLIKMDAPGILRSEDDRVKVEKSEMQPLPLWAEQAALHFRVLLATRSTQVDKAWRANAGRVLAPQDAVVNHPLMIDGIVHHDLVRVSLEQRDGNGKPASEAVGTQPPQTFEALARQPAPSDEVGGMLLDGYSGVLTDGERFRVDDEVATKENFSPSSSQPYPTRQYSAFKREADPCISVLGGFMALVGGTAALGANTGAVVAVGAAGAVAAGVAVVALSGGGGSGGSGGSSQAPSYEVAGRIRDSASQAVAGITVLAIDEDGFTQRGTSTTDQSGIYTMNLGQGFTGTIEPQPPAGVGTFTTPSGDSFYFISSLAAAARGLNFTFSPTKSTQTVFVDLRGIAPGSETVSLGVQPASKSTALPTISRTGEVTLEVVADGSTRIAPSLGDYGFVPDSAVAKGDSLTFALDTVTVGGRTVTADGTAVPAVILTATDASGAIAPVVAVSTQDGAFSFELPRKWRGALAIRRSGYSLNGTSVAFSAENANPISRLVGTVEAAVVAEGSGASVDTAPSGGTTTDGRLEIELVWTGAVDLDLRVQTPSGELIDPSASSAYIRDDAGSSGAVSAQDRIVLSNAAAGSYQFSLVLDRATDGAGDVQARVRVLRNGTEVAGSPVLDGAVSVGSAAAGSVLRQATLQID